MRRRSEKGKDKESPEKKLVRRSSRRHSKRRKRSQSSSPERDDSGEDTVSKLNDSQGDRNIRDGSVESEEEKSVKHIRSSKGKETSNSPGTSKSMAVTDEEWKEDTAFWTDDTTKEECSNIKNNEDCSLGTEESRSGEDNPNKKPAFKSDGDAMLEPKGRRQRRNDRRSNSDDNEGATTAAKAEKVLKPDLSEQNVEDDSKTVQEEQTISGDRVEKKNIHCDEKCAKSELQSEIVRENSDLNVPGENDLAAEAESEQDPVSETENKEQIIQETDAMTEENTLKFPGRGESKETVSDNDCCENVKTDNVDQKELLHELPSKLSNFAELEDPAEVLRRGASEESTEQRCALESRSETSPLPKEETLKDGISCTHSSSSEQVEPSAEVLGSERVLSTKSAKSESEEENGESVIHIPGRETPSSVIGLSSPQESSSKDNHSTAEKKGRIRKSSKESIHRKSEDSVMPDDNKHGEKPRRIKLFRASRDSAGSSASENAARHASPERRRSLDREHTRQGKTTDYNHRTSDGGEQRTYERVHLRRSFSEKNNSAVDSDVRRVSCDHLEADAAKDDKENENLPTNKETSSVGGISRKRRWVASRTSRASKKPVLSISSESLKDLVPGAKPLSAGEVQMTEDESHREVKIEIEESWSPKANEDDKNVMRPLVMLPETPKPDGATADDHGKLSLRKISIVSDEARNLQRSPSPPRHSVSDVLYITNLVRPFTVNQLKELLARTGTIVEGGFWIDKIKSRCYVQYENEEQARETRHALHGVRWPVSNPKQLCVDFGRREDMEVAQATSEAEQIPRKTEPLQQPTGPPPEEWERPRPPEERPRPHKVPPTVREWDLGKVGQLSPERDSRQEDRSKDRERKIRKEKTHRSRSISPIDALARKVKKKEDDAPAKLLDDLFRKTKTTPCIYWLPLTAEQIVVKEEMRRKHMAEHERRMAEMRKAERERERERARAQQRSRHRSGGTSGADRRSGRRRSPSGSPKK